MTPADGIRKFGFRRWYERQLIEGHAYLVTGFMSMVLVLACLEDANPRAGGLKPLVTLVVVVAAGVLCMVALGRYKDVLFRAEELAEQSVCKQCGVYGLLKVKGSRTAPSSVSGDIEPDVELLTVECKKCGHQWTMGPQQG